MAGASLPEERTLGVYSFQKDLVPVLTTYNCAVCHSEYGQYSNDLGLWNSAYAAMASGYMPSTSNKVTSQELQIMRDWIDSGMPP